MRQFESNNQPPLSYFDVLVDEYEHQMLARFGRLKSFPMLYGKEDAGLKNLHQQLREERRQLRRKLQVEYADVHPLSERQRLIIKRLKPVQAQQAECLRTECAKAWQTEIKAIVNKFSTELGLTNNETQTLSDELKAQLNAELQRKLLSDFYERLQNANQKQTCKARAKRAALCFSGGGIRSATFGLGVLQGLARVLDLGSLHYLSTVSGGGYLGSWFSTWIHRHGLAEAQLDLRDGWRAGQEAEPISHLRRYSNYLSPRLGIFSADTWTLLATYLRNLFLNWTVLLPLLSAVLLIPVILTKIFDRSTPWFPNLDARLHGLGRELCGDIALVISLMSGVVAVMYVLVNRGQSGRTESVEITNGSESQFLRLCFTPLWLSALSATAYWGFTNGQGQLMQSLLQKLLSVSQPAYIAQVNSGLQSQPTSLLMVLLKATVALLVSTLFFWLIGLIPVYILRFFREELYLPTLGTSLLSALLCCTLVISYYFIRQHPSLSSFVAFIAYGVAFNYSGVVMAHPFRRLRMADYVYGIFVGALGGALLYFLATELFPHPVRFLDWYICFAPPLFLVTLMLGATLSIGLTSYFNTDADREWMARMGGWLMLSIGGWLAVCGIALFAPRFWAFVQGEINAQDNWVVSAISLLGGGSAIVTLLGGWSQKSPANPDVKNNKENKLSLNLGDWAPLLAAPVFAVTILLLLALVSRWADNFLSQQFGPLATFVLLTLGGLIMGFYINVNKFSLHSTYRERLIRAYLGASRRADERQPNRFTGLDELDNIQFHELPVAVFHENAIHNFKDLAETLRQTDALKTSEIQNNDKQLIAQFVFQSFPVKTRELLRTYTGATQAQAQRALVEGLNQIIQRETLYTEKLLIPETNASLRLFSIFQDTFSQWFKRRFIASAGSDVKAAFGRLMDTDSETAQKLRELAAREPVMPGHPQKFLRQFFRMLKLEGWFKPRVFVHRLFINRELLRLAFAEYIHPLPRHTTEARPLHIINIALNLVAGGDLAWQERKALSLTTSPLHVGSSFLGYRRAWEYAINPRNQRALTLGTSLAISGAAASPNMGYHSSPIVTFLLALFNVRLGWWSGNPGLAGQDTYKLSSPYFAPKPLIDETFGLTNDQHPYVYLSDGGHFENLGLYEMVRRRCHYIIVSDAGQDGDFAFEDLGNALRKIHIDLGVPIIFEEIPISRRKEKPAPYFDTNPNAESNNHKYCAVARICYSRIDPKEEDGYLLYLKPTFYGNEPIDVFNYAIANPEFPHETTGDQFFSESQFESYRRLGKYAMEQITCGQTFDGIGKLFEQALKHTGKSEWPNIAQKPHLPTNEPAHVRLPDTGIMIE